MNGIIRFIVGQPEPGQRKMANGFYVEFAFVTTLLLCVIAMWFAPVDRATLFKDLGGDSIQGIKVVFGLLMGGNAAEHIAKAVGGNKAS